MRVWGVPSFWSPNLKGVCSSFRCLYEYFVPKLKWCLFSFLPFLPFLCCFVRSPAIGLFTFVGVLSPVPSFWTSNLKGVSFSFYCFYLFCAVFFTLSCYRPFHFCGSVFSGPELFVPKFKGCFGCSLYCLYCFVLFFYALLL